jgi:hypothetical protein
MEQPVSRIPQTDSIAELARFWDTHDLTDFEDELEVVSEPVFGPRAKSGLEIHLDPDEAAALRRLARSAGVEETDLVARWVREKLHAS